VCYICREYKGVLGYTNKGWCHHTCVNYMPEINFENEYKETITGDLELDRSGLFCYICKKKCGYSL